MALLPKAVDLAPGETAQAKGEEPANLAITTPESLPEAIAGRPYVVALAATGGRGPLRWSVEGPLPEGLSFDPQAGRIEGTPRTGTAEPAALVVRVSDGSAHASQKTRLLVYQSDRPLTTPSRWDPGLPPIPWRAWLEQGVGFLILWLIHLVGMNALATLERQSLARIDDVGEPDDALNGVRHRFRIYRLTVRLTTLATTIGLAVWLWRQHA
jgi:hypothetical protein